MKKQSLVLLEVRQAQLSTQKLPEVCSHVLCLYFRKKILKIIQSLKQYLKILNVDNKFMESNSSHNVFLSFYCLLYRKMIQTRLRPIHVHQLGHLLGHLGLLLSCGQFSISYCTDISLLGPKFDSQYWHLEWLWFPSLLEWFSQRL